MQILLPPSEGKAEPSDGRRKLKLEQLSFDAELGATRRKVSWAADRKLRQAAVAPATEIYTGVLFDRLDFAGLTEAAQRRAEDRVLIASAMWGLLRPADRIPFYKLPIGEKLPKLGGLAALWREPVAAVLDPLDHEGELFVDCRSSAYATVWRPRRAHHLEVRAFKQASDGSRKPISHMAKANRGELARVLLKQRGNPADPEKVLAIARDAGLDAELEGPGENGPGNRLRLDVIERD